VGGERKYFEIVYEQQQGVYLPHYILREYSLKSLGLRDGERVIDKVNGGEYRYQGGTLTSQPATRPAGGSAR